MLVVCCWRSVCVENNVAMFIELTEFVYMSL